MRIIRIILRTIVGLTFIFSGFVKGVDPLGSVYKFNEYFEAYGIEWLSPIALLLAILLCAVEFIVGVMLVFGVKPRLSSWLAFIIMFFFTGLTLYSAIKNPVTDCGCFGDALKLTNWETFYKNVVLIILVLFLVLTNKYSRSSFKAKTEISIFVLGAGFIVFISVYSLRHLPIIDFLPWKVGNNVLELVNGKKDIYLIYKDKKTGEKFEYTSKTLPWKDSLKMASLEYVDRRDSVLQEIKIPGFAIVDENKNVITDNILGNPKYQFILVACDLSETKKSAYSAINNFVEGCDKDTFSFIGLTSTESETVEIFRHDVNAIFSFYNVDDTALETMIRANPGILLLHNGVVIAKWHWRDLPEYSEVKEKYLK